MKEFFKSLGQIVFWGMAPMFLIIFWTVSIRWIEYPAQARHAADNAKYTINVGTTWYAYTANNYTYTNGTLCFYDELRQKQFVYVNRSFDIKTNTP